MRRLVLIVVFFASKLLVAQELNKDILRGDAYYQVGQYYTAIKYYKYGIKKTNEAEVLGRLIRCYHKINEPDKLIVAYRQLASIDIFKSKKYNLEYLSSLKKTGRYIEALSFAEKLYRADSLNDKIAIARQSVDTAMRLMNEKNNFIVENLKNINTEFSEISPAINRNTLVFASNREDIVIKNKPGAEELPFYDLYYTSFDSVTLAIDKKVKQFSSYLNTGTHESSVSFSGDGNQVFFTQHSEKVGSEALNANVARMKLFYLERVGGRWGNPHTFIFNDSTVSFAHPYLSKNGKIFFFVSDMAGGVGGTDIYFCVNDSAKGWSAPTNIGAPINTKGNELYPFYDEINNVLYFSSDTHPGMGGYDIFRADLDSEPIAISNVKAPINSTYDDFSLIFDKTLSYGFLSSNRKGGKGLEDIYIIKRKE